MALTLSDRTKVRPLNGAVVRQYEAGGAVQVGDAVYIDANDKVQKARGNANTTARGRGVVVAGEGVPPGTSYASGQSIAVCVHGPLAGFTGMDPLLSVYVDTSTADSVTQTKPSAGGTFAHSIGYPIRSDVLFVAPQMTDPTSN